MISRLGSWLSGLSTSPWSNVYGTARSLLALSTLGTLVLNETSNLFRPGSGMPDVPVVIGLGRFSLFALLAPHLEIARWIAVAILLIVVSGWRPRITGVLHWWVTFSLQASAINLDGGDHIATLLSMLLVPLTLTDSRRSHWSSSPEVSWASASSSVRQLVAYSSLVMIRLQVAAIYFHSAVAKTAVEEWVDGTAIYYWFTHSSVGAPPWLQPVLHPLLVDSVGVALITWGAVAFEMLLFMALTMQRRFWPPLLAAGILFHFAIAVIHGLVSFAMVMIAALILYLRPANRQFSFGWLRSAHGRRLFRISYQPTPTT